MTRNDMRSGKGREAAVVLSAAGTGRRSPDRRTTGTPFRDGLYRATVFMRRPGADATGHCPIMNTPTVPTPAVTGPTRVAHSTAPASRGASRAWPGRTRILTSDSAWAAAAAAVLILIAGAMTLATGHPWLFAALGPTAVTVASSPGHPTSRFHSIVVGHATAFVCAWLVVLLVGAA